MLLLVLQEGRVTRLGENAPRSVSVSYTHLDVYKRQAQPMGLAPAVNRATYKTPLDVLLPTISARSVGLLLVVLLVAGLQLTGCGSRLGPGTSSGPDAQWTRAQAAARAPELSAGYFEWRALDPQTGVGREAQARLAQAQEHYQHALQLLQKGQPGTRETCLLYTSRCV